MGRAALSVVTMVLLVGCAPDPTDACEEFETRLGKPMFEALSGLQVGTVTEAEAAALLGEGADGALEAAEMAGNTAVADSFEVLADDLRRYRVALVEGDPAGFRAEVRAATDAVDAACSTASS